MMPEQNGSSRLDRIERMLEMVAADHVRFQGRHEAFEEEHKRLLTAQVLLTDAMAKLAEAQRRTDERLEQVTQNLNALISVVDWIIRRPPLRLGI
jgi:hypothetical protein